MYFVLYFDCIVLSAVFSWDSFYGSVDPLDNPYWARYLVILCLVFVLNKVLQIQIQILIPLVSPLITPDTSL